MNHWSLRARGEHERIRTSGYLIGEWIIPCAMTSLRPPHNYNRWEVRSAHGRNWPGRYHDNRCGDGKLTFQYWNHCESTNPTTNIPIMRMHRFGPGADSGRPCAYFY